MSAAIDHVRAGRLRDVPSTAAAPPLVACTSEVSTGNGRRNSQANDRASSWKQGQ